VLAGLALAMLGGPALARRPGVEESQLYGVVGKMTAVPGKRDALIAILAEGTDAMPGCLAYIIAEDVKDAEGIWVTEIWKTRQYHDDALKLPAVIDAIARGRPLIAGFETNAETRPVAGVGIDG
jgi:quinol monooxygenase YgiN